MLRCALLLMLLASLRLADNADDNVEFRSPESVIQALRLTGAAAFEEEESTGDTRVPF